MRVISPRSTIYNTSMYFSSKSNYSKVFTEQDLTERFWVDRFPPQPTSYGKKCIKGHKIVEPTTHCQIGSEKRHLEDHFFVIDNQSKLNSGGGLAGV